MKKYVEENKLKCHSQLQDRTSSTAGQGVRALNKEFTFTEVPASKELPLIILFNNVPPSPRWDILSQIQ